MARGLLKLVHSLERKRGGLPYRTHMTISATAPDGTERLLGTLDREESRPRAWVIGAADRVDLGVPGGLLPRHVAVVSVPTPEGVLLRVLTLHPERSMTSVADGLQGAPLGSVEAWGSLDVSFEGFRLRVSAALAPDDASVPLEGVQVAAPGEQLAFFRGSPIRPVGNVVASIAGPGGGGHAIPALVADLPEVDHAGALVLHGRTGVHRLEPSWRELRAGVLIGRSRRCVLGRGFDENDGLSRIHALCLLLEAGVWVFDLASRYGLRDVARPTRLLSAARLDDGAGCLVYGAGHLIFEA